ncbi:MAG: tetratricopeptide repeat protein [Herminiimonas sp.]|nr:tetratricopeptide repeat protein [Herminiimonas sp.]
MKNAFIIVTLSTVLTACSTSLPKSASQASSPDSPATAAVVADSAPSVLKIRRTRAEPEVAAPEDALPTVELSEDLMFKLLVAEIGFQRGEWEGAYIAMLTAAQQTRDPRLARRAAEIALSAKQPGETMSAIRLWRDLAPNSDEAAQYYLGFVILGDNLEEARAILATRLTDARPAMRAMLMFQTQRLLARAKDKDAAFVLLEDLVAPYNTMPEAHLALSQSAFARGDMERARAEARSALAIKPDSELGALTMAQVIPDKNDALRYLAEFLTRYPKSSDVRVAYARVLVEQKQYDKARAEFETLLKEKPQDMTLLYALGMLEAQIDNASAAEKYLTTYLKLLAQKPDDERDPTQAILVLAQIAEDRKDPEAALKWLAQIESGEAFTGAQIKRAQLIAKRGDLTAARRLLSEIATDTERDKTLVILAESQLLRDAGQSREALALLDAGIKLFPTNTDLLYDSAMIAEKLNQTERMEIALRRVIELAPASQHAYNALGYSLAERNVRLPEALSLVEKALTIAPEDPFIMDSMGWVQFRLGNFKEAEALLRRAYALRPDAEIAVHLGEVLWVKGQKDDAKKFWRDANSKDPQSDALKSTLARLNANL